MKREPQAQAGTGQHLTRADLVVGNWPARSGWRGPRGRLGPRTEGCPPAGRAPSLSAAGGSEPGAPCRWLSSPWEQQAWPCLTVNSSDRPGYF